eukprot:3647214-Pyramimonas_sp.AAC.1
MYIVDHDLEHLESVLFGHQKDVSSVSGDGAQPTGQSSSPLSADVLRNLALEGGPIAGPSPADYKRAQTARKSKKEKPASKGGQEEEPTGKPRKRRKTGKRAP